MISFVYLIILLSSWKYIIFNFATVSIDENMLYFTFEYKTLWYLIIQSSTGK